MKNISTPTKIREFVVLLSVLVTALTVDANTISGPIVNPANGHAYYLLDLANWINSEAEAVSLGGHLVTINDASENSWVYDQFSSYGGVNRNLWIGLTDQAVEGQFKWISGESSSFLNFSTGEPNNYNGNIDGIGEDYVHFFSPYWSLGNPPAHIAGTWNDYKNADAFYENSTGQNNMYGVVEVATPDGGATLALLGGAFTMLGALRRKFVR
jgi:hypothetical protein